MKNIFSVIIRIFFGILIIYYIYDTIDGWKNIQIDKILEKVSTFKIIVCCIAYLLSHFVRALRFSLMTGRQNFSIGSLTRTQYFTNSVNLLAPFKIGELFRIIRFERIIKDYQKTFFTIVAERSIDFIMIFTGMFIAIYFVNTPLWEIKVTVYIGMFIILSMLYIFMAMPQNLRFINIFIAKRSTSIVAVKFLKISSSVHDSVEKVRDIFLKEKSTLLLLSIMIWTLETSSFWFIHDFSPSIWHTVLLACLVFMSGILPSGTLGLGGIQLAFFFIFKQDNPDLSLGLSISYQLFIFLPAVILGFAVWIFHKKSPIIRS